MAGMANTGSAGESLMPGVSDYPSDRSVSIVSGSVVAKPNGGVSQRLWPPTDARARPRKASHPPLDSLTKEGRGTGKPGPVLVRFLLCTVPARTIT